MKFLSTLSKISLLFCEVRTLASKQSQAKPMAFLHWLVSGPHVMNFQILAAFVAGWQSETPPSQSELTSKLPGSLSSRDNSKWASLVVKQQLYSGKILLLNGHSLAWCNSKADATVCLQVCMCLCLFQQTPRRLQKYRHIFFYKK